MSSDSEVIESADPLVDLREELEALELSGLLARLRERTGLSMTSLATAAGDDPSKWTRLLQGTEQRPISADHLYQLERSLPEEPDLSAPFNEEEWAIWRRSLVVASWDHQAAANLDRKRVPDTTDEKWASFRSDFRSMLYEQYDSHTKSGFQWWAALPPAPALLDEIWDRVLRHQGGTGPGIDVRPARRTARFIEPELVRIPAGAFLMGSDDGDELAYRDEKPLHEIVLREYWIGRTPVTNEEYSHFLRDRPERSAPEYWGAFGYPAGTARHPVVGVKWTDTVARLRLASGDVRPQL